MEKLDFYDDQGIRLQKYLAHAGVASRRAAENLIAEGRVSADGKKVTSQGIKINPEKSIVRVDGERVELNNDYLYIAYYKPRGIYTTMHDEEGRLCIGDILVDKNKADLGLFHVGRLDADSEGLLLLTNDGDLGNRLTHPSYEVEKEYLVTVKGKVRHQNIDTLLAGIELDDGVTKFTKCQIVDYNEGITILRIVIKEGKNRIIRRMLKKVGYPVLRLVRVRIGNILLENQRSNAFRYLNKGDVAKLYKMVGL